jgi:2-polyprenyl-6-methoxyphenol hydroxylase and related FAD-dependent oxidoreductases
MDDVLITGAGPTGLVLALWLTAQGVKVRIIDKKEGPGDTSRAMVVQARTLELYRQLGLAEPVLEAGNRMVAINMWTRGHRAARLALADAGAGLSPYPSPLMYPQDHHERLLGEKLESMGVRIERNTEVLSMEQGLESVSATLRKADGTEEVTTARYLAGCDGARSTVRESLGLSSRAARIVRCSTSPTSRSPASIPRTKVTYRSSAATSCCSSRMRKMAAPG